jgi:hypothetical protein
VTAADLEAFGEKYKEGLRVSHNAAIDAASLIVKMVKGLERHLGGRPIDLQVLIDHIEKLKVSP